VCAARIAGVLAIAAMAALASPVRAAAAVTVHGSNVGSVGSGTSATVALPAVSPGDVVLVNFFTNASTGGAVTFTAPSGYSIAGRQLDHSYAHGAVYYHVYAASDPTSVTFRSSVSAYLSWAVVTYSGAATDGPIGAASAQANSSSSVATSASITPDNAGSLLVMAYDAPGNVPSGAWYSPSEGTMDAGQDDVAMAHYQLTGGGATGQQTIDMNTAQNNGWQIELVPFSISVSGSHLVNGSGQTVFLHGAYEATGAFACLNGWGTFNQPHDQTQVNSLLAWHINDVHISLNEDCWLDINGEPVGESASQYRSDVLKYVQLLEANGIYAVLDMQYMAPGSYVSDSEEGLPDYDHAADFWTSVATTMANEKGVSFQLADEPTCYLPSNINGGSNPNCDWNAWKSGTSGMYCRDGNCAGTTYKTVGMQGLIDSIRNAEGSGWHHVIFAPTLGFSLSLGTWPSYVPTDSAGQLAAATSDYNDTSGGNDCDWTDTSCLNTYIAAPVNAGYPVVIAGAGNSQGQSSWGTSDTTFLGWLNTNTSGYALWSFEDEDNYALTTDGVGASTSTRTTRGAAYDSYLNSTFP
jgi:endoglucanase